MLTFKLRQITNLEYFLDARLNRDLQALERTDGEKTLWDSVALLESVLWLYFGILIGYFPRNESLLVRSEFLSVLEQAHTRVARKGLMSRFPPSHQQAIKAMVGPDRDLLFKHLKTTSRSSELQHFFQTFLLLSNGLDRSKQAHSIIQALNTTDLLGARFLAGRFDMEVVVGVQEILGYLETFRSLSREISDQASFLERMKNVRHWSLERARNADKELRKLFSSHPIPAWGNLLGLKDYLKGVQWWRFYFYDEAISTAFLGICERVIMGLEGGKTLRETALLKDAVPVTERAELMTDIQSLISDWKDSPSPGKPDPDSGPNSQRHSPNRRPLS
jgi:hypothetical protein